MKLRIVFVFIILLLHIRTWAGDMSFRHVSGGEGLKYTWVWNIFKDSRGYMWFSTTYGAYRYNGYSFEEYTFKHLKNDFRSKIYFVYEDSKNNLWFGTDHGLYLYNRLSNQYTRYSDEKESPVGLSSNIILCMKEDIDGVIWVGTDRGINKLDIAAGTNVVYQSLYDSADARVTNLIYSILLDTDHNLWIGGGNGLVSKYDRDRKEFKTLSYEQLPCHENINRLYEDEDKNLWIGSNGDGAFRLDRKTLCSVHYCEEKQNLSNNIVRDFGTDAKGNIWIGTEKGITLCTKAGIEYVYAKSTQTDGLSDNAIYCIYADEKKNMWIGTFFGGVNVHYAHSGLFHTVAANKGDYSIQRGAISSILCENEKILVGTENYGLFVLNMNHDLVGILNTDNSNISSNNIHSLCVDNQQNLWIGTYYGGVNLLSKGSSLFKHYRQHIQDSKSISYNNVYCILQDSKGTIWVGTQFGGLCVYNPVTHTIERAAVELPADLFVWDLLEDRRGNIWIASYNYGVFLLDKSQNYKVVALPEQVYNNITLRELNDGRIAVGSENTGLAIINPADLSICRYTEKNGLCDNTIYAILQDKNNQIWLSTNQGLCKCNPDFSLFTHYTINDGLPTNRFNYKAGANIGSKLYFGSTEGLVVVEPEQEKNDSYIYPIWWNNLYINGEKQTIGQDNVLHQDLNVIDEICLDYRNTSWGVDFTCNVFEPYNRPQFAYQLSGQDGQWHKLGSKTRIDFTGLNYGHYQLSICTVDKEGNLADNKRTLNIYIRPPWWQRLPAKLSFTLILLGSAFYLIFLLFTNARSKHALALEKLERKKDQEINELKFKFFVNISHEFKTPLSLILGPVNQFMENRVKESNANHYYNIIKKNADKLLNLINELLAFRELEHLKLHIEPIQYEQFIVSVLHKHTLMFESKGIHVEIKGFEGDMMIHADADKLEKIFDNLLSNAYKYTNQNGTITIEVKSAAGQVTTTLTNTGDGIDPKKIPFIFERFFTNSSYDRYSSGVGLSYVKSLVEMHEGEITATSLPKETTSFCFSIPLRDNLAQATPRSVVDYRLDVFSENPYQNTDNEEFSEPEFIKMCEGTHVLVAEDDQDLREIITDYLSASFKVSVVDSAEAAISFIAEQKVDIIVSDVKMKEMSGYDLCKTLKSNIETSHIRIILMTVLSEDSYKYSGYKSGADAYMTKPFELSLLELRIRNLLYNSFKAKQKYKIDIDLSNVEVTHSNSDEEFLNKAVAIVFKHLADTELNVDFLCNELGMSKASLYRKLHAITGQSINEFIQNIRLKYAARLLIETDKTVAEIAYEVGFSDSYYFSRAFKKCFGQSPKQWRESGIMPENS